MVGTVQFYPNASAPTKVGFIASDGTNGITWLSKVWITDSAVFGPHQFCHVQLIAPRRYVRAKTSNGVVADNFDPGNALTDATNKWLDGSFVYDGTYSTGASNGMVGSGFGDAPAFDQITTSGLSELLAITGLKSGPTVESEKFTTYLMFKPLTPGGCWVPLKKFDWEWQMQAEFKMGAWTLTQISVPTNPASSDTHEHPLWQQ